MIIRNSIGWEDSLTGIQVAYSKECAFMNTCRNPKFKLPIWKESSEKKEMAK